MLDVSAADICVSGYSKRVRNVPSDVKRQAYALYGIRNHEPGEYEVDHLISLSLGGSNSIRNLWPESFRTSPWNAYVKDALENELHRRVCAGTIDLAKAQFVISQNWVAGYRTYVQGSPPSTIPRNKQRSHRARSQPQFQGPVP
ncbi:MAG: HNH endonuclease [Gemmatimonadaceae bacterium]